MRTKHFASAVRLAAFFFLAMLVALPANAATVTFNLYNLISQRQTNQVVTITPISPPFLDGTNLITASSYTTNSGTTGSFTLTDMASASYRVSISTRPRATEFIIQVPNDTNSYSATDVAVVNPPSGPGLPIATLDNRYVKRTNGWATNLYVTNLNVNLGNTATGTYLRRGTNGLPYWDTVTASGGSGELWTTNAALATLSSNNAANLTNGAFVATAAEFSARGITNIIHIANIPTWGNAGIGTADSPRNATNEIAFFNAMDRGELKANTVYSFRAGNVYNFTNVNFLRSNTIVLLNGSILNMGTNTTQIGEAGKVYAFVSKDYSSPGAQIRDGTIKLNGYLNQNHTNAIAAVGIWGDGSERISNIRSYDAKGNNISGSECFDIFAYPANTLPAHLGGARIENCWSIHTNNNDVSDYVGGITIGGARDTNTVVAQGLNVIEGCTVIGSGKNLGWSYGYSSFGRSRVINSKVAHTLWGVYHELQSGGNSTTDNGMGAVVGCEFEDVVYGVNTIGFWTNQNFRVTGNTFSNFTYGVRFLPAGDPITQGVGQMWDVMIDHNHFGPSGTNPHWNVYLANTAGTVHDNIMHSDSNYFGTGTVTNLTSTNAAPVSLWNNILTNGGAATTNLIAGNFSLAGSAVIGGGLDVIGGTGNTITNVGFIDMDNNAYLSWGAVAGGPRVKNASATQARLLIEPANSSVDAKPTALVLGTNSASGIKIERPAGTNSAWLQLADGSAFADLYVANLYTNGVQVTGGSGGSGGGFATGIDTTQLYTNSGGTLGINELALMTNVVLEGAVITNDTATSIPVIVDTTSTNRLVSYRLRGTELVGIATNGAVHLGNNMSLISANTGSIYVQVSGNNRLALSGAQNATVYTAQGGGLAADTSFTPGNSHAQAAYSFRADVIGSWSLKSNLLVHSTATVTNGFIHPTAALSASPVILNFGPTNMAQTLDVTGNITIGTTNRTAGQYVERIVKLKVTSGGPHTITWAEANLHSLPAQTLLTNGTTLLISAGCWGTATNDVLIGTKYFQ